MDGVLVDDIPAIFEFQVVLPEVGDVEDEGIECLRIVFVIGRIPAHRHIDEAVGTVTPLMVKESLLFKVGWPSVSVVGVIARDFNPFRSDPHGVIGSADVLRVLCIPPGAWLEVENRGVIGIGLLKMIRGIQAIEGGHVIVVEVKVSLPAGGIGRVPDPKEGWGKAGVATGARHDVLRKIVALFEDGVADFHEGFCPEFLPPGGVLFPQCDQGVGIHCGDPFSDVLQWRRAFEVTLEGRQDGHGPTGLEGEVGGVRPEEFDRARHFCGDFHLLGKLPRHPAGRPIFALGRLRAVPFLNPELDFDRRFFACGDQFYDEDVLTGGDPRADLHGATAFIACPLGYRHGVVEVLLGG